MLKVNETTENLRYCALSEVRPHYC